MIRKVETMNYTKARWRNQKKKTIDVGVQDWTVTGKGNRWLL
jgi:hypothetical protein